MALARGDRIDSAWAIRILLGQLMASDWDVIGEAEQTLLENYERTRSAIESEIQSRRNARDLESRKLLARLRALAQHGESA
jgi:hypothetical protein